VLIDVNQFSIITELLGTPPDDVIATICSENVCLLFLIALELTNVKEIIERKPRADQLMNM
jgi:p38 MAP kinase